MIYMAGIIGRTALEMYPASCSEVEAVDLLAQKIYRQIQFKLKFNIAAEDDIDFYKILEDARGELLRDKVLGTTTETDSSTNKKGVIKWLRKRLKQH